MSKVIWVVNWKFAGNCKVILLFLGLSINFTDTVSMDFRKNDSECMLNLFEVHSNEDTLLTKIQSYLQDGADINIKTSSSSAIQGPIFNIAIERNYFKIIKFLLSFSSLDINILGGLSNSSPLHHAILNNNIELIKILLKRNAKVDQINNYEQHTLFCCATQVDILKLLLSVAKKQLNKDKFKLFINTKDHRGHVPLLFAISWGAIYSVKLLIEEGADPNIDEGINDNLDSLEKRDNKNKDKILSLLIERIANTIKEVEQCKKLPKVIVNLICEYIIN